jgi:hypothetical protein
MARCSTVHSIKHYVIKFVSDLQWFSPGTPISSTNKTDCYDITEILMKVALNTKTKMIIGISRDKKTQLNTY